MKKLLLLMAIVLLTVLGLLLFAICRPEQEPPLPSPNGYDDFLKAANRVSPSPPDWQRMTLEEQREVLTAFVAANRPALDLVQTGLTQECRMVPWEDGAASGSHLNDLAKTKAVAQAIAAASQLALIEGRTNEAAALATDCIRYGGDWARGGVLIDGLVGLAVRGIGLSQLKHAAAGLDAENARKTIVALEKVVDHGESFDEVIRRERQWARRGRFGRMGLLSWLIQPIQDRKQLEKARQKFLKGEAEIQRMRIQLAALAFELDHAKPPASIQELVPRYLNAVPLDPVTGGEMQLR